jgi:ATP-dependent Clp protease ATP-binding subunit ClpA
MNSIVIKFLNELESYVAQRNIDISWGPALQTMLEDKGYDPQMGARPLARLINEKVKLPLAKYLLDIDSKKKLNLKVEWKKDELVINGK